jgi:hypothetical protein
MQMRMMQNEGDPARVCENGIDERGWKMELTEGRGVVVAKAVCLELSDPACRIPSFHPLSRVLIREPLQWWWCRLTGVEEEDCDRGRAGVGSSGDGMTMPCAPEVVERPLLF